MPTRRPIEKRERGVSNGLHGDPASEPGKGYVRAPGCSAFSPGFPPEAKSAAIPGVPGSGTSSPRWKSDRAEMGAAGPAARREEGEYSAYLTDEQRSRRAGSARFGDGRLPPRAASPGREIVVASRAAWNQPGDAAR